MPGRYDWCIGRPSTQEASRRSCCVWCWVHCSGCMLPARNAWQWLEVWRGCAWALLQLGWGIGRHSTQRQGHAAGRRAAESPPGREDGAPGGSGVADRRRSPASQHNRRRVEEIWRVPFRSARLFGCLAGFYAHVGFGRAARRACLVICCRSPLRIRFARLLAAMVAQAEAISPTNIITAGDLTNHK